MKFFEKHSDKILYNKNLYMEPAGQIISDDKNLRSNRVQDSGDFNSQSLATQAKKGDRLVFYDAYFQKAFYFNGR